MSLTVDKGSYSKTGKMFVYCSDGSKLVEIHFENKKLKKGID